MQINALIVDDEPLARQRLAQLLGRLDPPVPVLAQCQDAGSALAWLESHPGQTQVCFLDIQIPGPDGLRLADKISSLPQAPQVVFVTAHAEHALRAFELDASDYLTKPVRLERLAQALVRCRRHAMAGVEGGGHARPVGELVVQDRQRIVRVPCRSILYLKAEQKYVTVYTLDGPYIIDESLSDLEGRLGQAFVRVHRNALVAVHAIRALERQDMPDAGEGWAVQVTPSLEWLPVSRRQLPAVREALAGR